MEHILFPSQPFTVTFRYASEQSYWQFPILCHPITRYLN
ncbi:hypothetical protein PHET_03677 [Paragonimus heterotremus]|uniref:Uncharacterized protein n=1 Tax=Paragonimus heterotremus TaxID=100268 RepID=A0A8J4SR12_9TREM|nr:hypothetical protein PHET_03677 [Paragonimus heterotremus]